MYVAFSGYVGRFLSIFLLIVELSFRIERIFVGLYRNNYQDKIFFTLLV